MSFSKNLLRLIVLFVVGACSSAPPENTRYLSIMAYNVENLFDTEHDQGKEDFTFLPQGHSAKRKGCLAVKVPYRQRQCFNTDWTSAKLALKLGQIKRVVENIEGVRPDFLALSEIENENVIKQLAQELGYPHYAFSDGADVRGIDLALMWNEKADIKWQATREIEIVDEQGKPFGERPTRPVLEVHFVIAGKYPVFFYLNHWPSQGGPNQHRVLAARTLRKEILERKAQNPLARVIALGDFNVIESNQPNAIFDILLPEAPLIDVHQAYFQRKTTKPKPMPLGTYFFARDNTWNLLDRIIVSTELLESKELYLDLASYEIHAANFMTKKHRYRDKESPHYGQVVEGVPKRYQFKAKTVRGAGFSDHFPVFVRLRYKATHL